MNVDGTEAKRQAGRGVGTEPEIHREMRVEEPEREAEKQREEGEDRTETGAEKEGGEREKRQRYPTLQTRTHRTTAALMQGGGGGAALGDKEEGDAGPGRGQQGDGGVREADTKDDRKRGRQGVGMGKRQEEEVLEAPGAGPACPPHFLPLWSSQS